MAVRFTRTSSQYWSRTSGAVLDYNADYTLMAWVYLTTDVNGYYSFFGVWGNIDSSVDCLQTTNQGDVLNLYCANVDTTSSIDANGATLPIGQWIHLALAHERKSLTDTIVRAYLNGAQNIVGSFNTTGRRVSSNMRVGSWYGTSDYANGRVAQIKAFQHILTPDQIRAEMESAQPINVRTLFGWWPVREPGAGVRNRDWSGNGYDWTETATPTDEADPPFNFAIDLIPIQWQSSTSDVTINAPIATVTADAIAPAVTTTSSITITVPLAEATAQAIAPAIGTGATVTAPIATATAEAIAPTVTVVSNVTIAAPIATATAEAIAPAVGAGSNVTIDAPIVAATAEAVAPTIGTGATVTAPAAAATAQTIAPTIGAGVTVTVPAAASSTAQAIAPTITTTSSVTIAVPIATATAEAIPPTVISATQDHSVDVGNGYSDVTPKQIVRTSGNVLYVSGWKFDTWPWGVGTGNHNTQTLRMYKAGQTGLPTSFTRLDSSNEPVGVVSWAMAIDRDDVIHVVWTTRATWGVDHADSGTDNYLRYCQFSTATDTWGTVENIETSMATHEIGQGDEMVSIAIDASGVPHILYLKDDGTRRRVNYRNRAGGSWSSASIVDDQSFSAGQCCWHPGIVFDTAGRMVATWMRGDDLVTSWTATTGRYFVRVYSGSWGTTHDVTGANIWTGIDTGTPIYVDTSGRYHTCFISTGKDARYYYSDDQGASWTANNPSSGTYTADNPTPAPGPSGKVRIYCHGESSTNIVYFEGDGGGAAWSAATNYITDTGYDCSVNVRWSQYWNWRPSTHDVAYWKSDYPTNELYVGTDVLGSDVIIRAPIATVTAEAIAPAVTTTSTVTISAPIATSTADAIAPVVSVVRSVTISVPAAEATAQAIAPAIGVGVTVTAPAATVTADAIAPAVTTISTVTISAPIATATADAIAPAVATMGNVTISAPVATATAEAIVPAIGVGVTVTAPIATATAEAIAPVVTVTSGVTISAPIATATAEAIAPTVTATRSVTIVAPVSTATAEAIAPAVSTMGNITISVPFAEATAEAIAPVVTVTSVVTISAPIATAMAAAIAPTVITGVAPYDVLAIAVSIDRGREFEMTIERARDFEMEF